MIIKKIKNLATWNGLKESIAYISSNFRDERVLEIGYENLWLQEPKLVWYEMRAMHMLCKGPYYNRPTFNHYVIAPGIQDLDNSTIKDIVKDFLKEMTYDKCQCYYVIHGDTDYKHVHVIVNRYDVESKKIVRISKDLGGFEIRRLHEVAAKLADTYNCRTNDVNRIYKKRSDSHSRKDEENNWNGEYEYVRATDMDIDEYYDRKRASIEEKVDELEGILSKDIEFGWILERITELGWEYYYETNKGRIYLVNRRYKIWIDEQKLVPEARLTSIYERMLKRENQEQSIDVEKSCKELAERETMWYVMDKHKMKSKVVEYD